MNSPFFRDETRRIRVCLTTMRTKYLLVSALGIWTAVLSCLVVIPRAVDQLAARDVSDVATAVLALATLLAIGGSRAAWDGIKHFRAAA